MMTSLLGENAAAVRIKRILLVAAGGSLGALSRYGTGLLALKLFGSAFPWGTLIVNLSGCFLIGLAFALAGHSKLMSPSMRLFFMTGFLGGLTTFSTFALETVHSIRNGAHLTVAVNFLSNNVGGFALVLLGMRLGRIK